MSLYRKINDVFVQKKFTFSMALTYECGNIQKKKQLKPNMSSIYFPLTFCTRGYTAQTLGTQ